MAISVITAADIPTITRTGTFIENITGLDPVVDNGVDMNLGILGSASATSDNAISTPITSNPALGVAGASYSVGGVVNFDGIVTEIPAAARITKIEVRCLLDYSISMTNVASADMTGLVDGYAKAGINIKIQVQNTAFTPTTDTALNDLDTDVNGAPASSMSLAASVNEPGLILEKIWDIENDLGQFPLGYIDRDILVAQFDNQKILMIRPTPSSPGSTRIGCYGENAWSGTVSLHYIISLTATTIINTSLWTMTVHWEEPVSWDLANPSPVEEGDPIEITSSGPDALDGTQITSVTLEWTDGTGPHSITVPPANWITITVNLFIFTLPPLVDAPQIFNVVITSTQFTGSVTLGKLATIFLINATGIYTLVPGKTNDTLYDNDNGGDPVEVAIPNPFADLGFIGG